MMLKTKTFQDEAKRELVARTRPRQDKIPSKQSKRRWPSDGSPVEGRLVFWRILFHNPGGRQRS
jgi:hypothetical protein